VLLITFDLVWKI